ncbi:unnamed protein product [Parascedosporium putredinis]|uniref:Uncharacterized protein n=1 Tax=Parascedosporium putredinis TaxID=1442378 RepID=A0A9P1GVN4_9PEZI|nr:unnamed protein product [Parascedosporium putredinis]CAI7988202.1 unnamed protein product [Parascedosporium putredinis]
MEPSSDKIDCITVIIPISSWEGQPTLFRIWVTARFVGVEVIPQRGTTNRKPGFKKSQDVSDHGPDELLIPPAGNYEPSSVPSPRAGRDSQSDERWPKSPLQRQHRELSGLRRGRRARWILRKPCPRLLAHAGSGNSSYTFGSTNQQGQSLTQSAYGNRGSTDIRITAHDIPSPHPTRTTLSPSDLRPNSPPVVSVPAA